MLSNQTQSKEIAPFYISLLNNASNFGNSDKNYMAVSSYCNNNVISSDPCGIQKFFNTTANQGNASNFQFTI